MAKNAGIIVGEMYAGPTPSELLQMAKQIFRGYKNPGHFITEVDNFDFSTLLATKILREELPRSFSRKKIEDMVKVNVIGKAQNLSTLFNNLSPSVQKTINEFKSFGKKRTEKTMLKAIAGFSPEAKAVFLANLTAGIEANIAIVKETPFHAENSETLKSHARYIIQTTQNNDMNPALIKRITKSFNAYSSLCNRAPRLVHDKEGLRLTCRTKKPAV